MAAITVTRDKLRLELGDTDTTNYVFNDDELDYFLTEETNNVLKARLRAAEAAVFRFARSYDFATDGQSFKRSQQATAYAEMAKQLRAQGVTTASDPGGFTTVNVTKVDGYSSDITNDEVAIGGTASSRARYYGGGRFYNDLPS